jgi:FkbM family methyltransferase
MNIIIRILFFLYRFFQNINNLGLKNSIKSMILARFIKKELFLNLKGLNFYFLPIIHHGSYSRFQVEQYIINDDFDDKNKIEHIIDAGANTGSQAIRFFHYYQNLQKIICIEPDFANYKYLNKNLDNQKCINIHAALSSSINDKISLNYNNFEKKKNGKPTNKSELITTSIKNGDDIKNLIKIVTINSIIKQFHLDKIDFFKCDLNGFEKEIFKANTEWINICKSFAFNNADLNNDIEDIINIILKSNKFRIYNLDQMILLISKKTNWFAEKKFFKN